MSLVVWDAIVSLWRHCNGIEAYSWGLIDNKSALMPNQVRYLNQPWTIFMALMHIFQDQERHSYTDQTINGVHMFLGCRAPAKSHILVKMERDATIGFITRYGFKPSFMYQDWNLELKSRIRLLTIWSYFASKPYMHRICLRQVFIPYATNYPRPQLHRTPGDCASTIKLHLRIGRCRHSYTTRMLHVECLILMRRHQQGCA